jgi:hypothetical protein
MALKINISEELISKAFSLTAVCKDLETAIQRAVDVLKTSNAGNKSFALYANKAGKISILGIGGDSFVAVVASNCKAVSPGIIGFEPDTFLGIIKNRNVMDFNFTDSGECAFNITKGKYSGKVVTLPITSDLLDIINSTLNPKEGKNEINSNISQELLSLIKEGLAVTAVKDVFNSLPLLSYLEISPKALKISTFDNHHFSFYEKSFKYKGDPFCMATPSVHFQTIDKLVTVYGELKTDINFSIKKEKLFVATDNFIVVLPLTQADDRNFKLIPELLKDLNYSEFNCEIEMDKLCTVVDNLFTLHKVNTSFNFSFKEGSTQLKLLFSSPSGSASDMLKIKPLKAKEITAKVEPKLYKDVIDLARPLAETTLHIKKNKAIVIKALTKLEATVTYVCSLI